MLFFFFTAERTKRISRRINVCSTHHDTRNVPIILVTSVKLSNVNSSIKRIKFLNKRFFRKTETMKRHSWTNQCMIIGKEHDVPMSSWTQVFDYGRPILVVKEFNCRKQRTTLFIHWQGDSPAGPVLRDCYNGLCFFFLLRVKSNATLNLAS